VSFAFSIDEKTNSFSRQQVVGPWFFIVVHTAQGRCVVKEAVSQLLWTPDSVRDARLWYVLSRSST